MNERIEKLMYESGLTADGCWDEMDSYDRDAIKRLIELTIRECAASVKHVAKMGGSNYGEHILAHFKLPVKL